MQGRHKTRHFSRPGGRHSPSAEGETGELVAVENETEMRKDGIGAAPAEDADADADAHADAGADAKELLPDVVVLDEDTAEGESRVTLNCCDCARMPEFCGSVEIKLIWYPKLQGVSRTKRPDATMTVKTHPSDTPVTPFITYDPAAVLTLSATRSSTGGYETSLTRWMANVPGSELTDVHRIVTGLLRSIAASLDGYVTWMAATEAASAMKTKRMMKPM